MYFYTLPEGMVVGVVALVASGGREKRSDY
jgi:hypothetical protein